MSNRFTPDILLQAEDPHAAAAFYVDVLGFRIDQSTPAMVTIKGPHINMFITRDPPLGPVLEVKVESLAAAKAEIVRRGGAILREEPEVPRCYVRDPFGMVYNLAE